MITISGLNEKKQLGEEANNKNINGSLIIYPPINSKLDPTSILCFSSNDEHSVLITTDYILKAIGTNIDGRIYSKLPKKQLLEYTEYVIVDDNELPYKPLSVVCGLLYTLYIVSNQANNYQLVYSHADSKAERPLFLNIGDRKPISLFGGGYNSAAIDSENGILLINEKIINSPNTLIKPAFLPNEEKAISLACCDQFIFALSKSGKVFESPISNNNNLHFEQVEELSETEIENISGTNDHCFAISKNGKVFGRGSNANGKLGIGKNNKIVSKFIEIDSLKDYTIISAYTGQYHSLFQTSEGKILSCGSNNYGELLLNKNLSKDLFYLPVETIIKKRAKFCIAGGFTSFIFVDIEPKFSPNRKIIQTNDKESEISKLKKLLFLKEKEISSLRNEIKKMKNKEFCFLEVNDIENLKKIKQIGYGGQSSVFQVSREQSYALKIINENASFEQKKKFFQEYELLNLIDHPNIIKAFGFCLGDQDHAASILLELCPYCLNNVVKQLTDIECVTIIFEICETMKYVHNLNIIHRDLSPENIFLDEKKHVKIGDFGIASLIDTGEQSRTSGIGKLKFMAPEILSENHYYDEKVDVYSFSIIVFYILTKGEYPNIIIIDIGNGKRAIIPSFINEFSKDLITCCWAMSPKDRPSFAEIVEKIKNVNFKLIDGVENYVNQINDHLSYQT